MLPKERQEHLDAFYRCSTKKEALAFLNTFSPLKVREICLFADEARMTWLKSRRHVGAYRGRRCTRDNA